MKHKGILFTVLAFVMIFGVTIAQAEVLPPGGGSGAIFTTTPDGSIVNENVHYAGRHYVYLDGGPKQNAPSTAAGLDEGFYVFQITDPPGKLLLSRDPARCRIVHVNAAGVIDQLMAPTENILEDPDGNTVFDYTGAGTDNWQDPGNGNRPYDDEPCHVSGPALDSAPGNYVPTPDITGVGRHDTNPDVDHNDVGAIVAQMMPYGLTPNPGGVYKAWMTPIQAYVTVKGADLNKVPSKINGQVKPHPCYDFCALADPGFVPSHRYTKTDNFKVTEKFPAEIKVRKFEDLDGDGIWDEGEPEIGLDKCVDINGNFIACPGGWPYDFTEPVNGGTTTDTFYTPFTHVAGVAGTYTACEFHLPGWLQTAAYVDGVMYNANQCVNVSVLATAPGEKHEIIFGNYKKVDVEACKYDDKTGDGLTADDTPIPGWTVHLTKNGVKQDTQPTGANGCYKWTDLDPVPGGYYDVSEDVPAGWTPTSATSHNFESPPKSGASYTFTFTNFKNVDVEACKYDDKTGDGLSADDTPIKGWTVKLTKNGVVQDTKPTGDNGCYKWTDLGPVPGGYYDVSEDVPAGWTPTSATSHNFESPPKSGASYTFTFTNFKNVDVTACKLKDADGSLATTDDQTPKSGWPVYLTKNGDRQDTQLTGDNGCYTWENLAPVPGGYYDVGEDPQEGWIALGDTYHAFESPPQSGASYSFTFVNTPTQGCTPGFWQGGNGFETAGGKWLWNVDNDTDWVASGGDGFNPYKWLDSFCGFFVCSGGSDMWYHINPDMWSVNDDFHKAARSLTAAYLNASWGMAYAYSTDELMADWADALANGTLLDLHYQLDKANNAIGGCPISASIP